MSQADAPRPRPLGALWASASQEPPWDVVVVGSGYGGAAAAAELAGRKVADASAPSGRRPIRLLVLERGRAWQPGAFPGTLAELPGHLRLADTATGDVGGQEEGLFDLRPGPDVVALVANGLGGGSLINAGVLLEPDPSDLKRADFAQLVTQLRDEGHLARARRLLGGLRQTPQGEAPNTIGAHPRHQQHPLRKAVALHRLADAARAPGVDPQARPAIELPITVAMEPTTGPTGHRHAACTLCGDCMTGCNVGAKRSLDTTLLAQAMARGAQVVTGASVTTVQPDHVKDAGPRWRLAVRHTRRDLQAREQRPLRLAAHHVILAAGTLGSTEILLRSRGGGLALSPRLGERFSCNGDNLAAVHRMALPVQGVADEAQPLDGREVGPTITTGVRLHPTAAGGRPFWLQEFAVPAALRWLFDETVTTGHTLGQLASADESEHGREDPATPDPAAVDPGAMARTLLVGLIGHDDADGVLALPRPMESPTPPQPGTLRIHWPQARDGRALGSAAEHLTRLVDALRKPQPAHRRTQAGDGPHLVPNPLWRPLPPAVAEATGTPAGPVLTVHPLGGCPIGPDADRGVVDDCGRVFDAADPSRQAHHAGLVVLDGAIVPESLGANPSLTITALALRAARTLADEWGFGPPAEDQGAELDGREPGTGEHSEPGVEPRRDAADAEAERPVHPAAAVTPATPRQPADGFSSSRHRTAPPRPTSTIVAITERLTGEVRRAHAGGAARAASGASGASGPSGPSLASGASGAAGVTAAGWVMELTLAYRPLALAALTHSLGRTMHVDPCSPFSRVRLYDAAVWAERGLAGLDDDARAAHAVFDAAVEGTLDVLQREPSRPTRRRLRALVAWQRHRLWRDLWQAATDPDTPASDTAWWRRGLRLAGEAWALASRAGEVRRFDYRLRLGAAQVDRLGLARQADGRPGPWAPGAVIEGCKRLTYAAAPPGQRMPRAGNPWRQLTELQITRLPGSGLDGRPSPPPSQAANLGTLVLDARFLAQRQAPLLRIVRQDNQVQALTELASLGLMLLRMVVGIHLWTFRLPDRPAIPSEPVRLPQAIAGLPPPQVTELVVDHDPDGSPVVVRLTRYPPAARRTPANPGAPTPPIPPIPPGANGVHGQEAEPPGRLPALVMIHGYSVSGNTFTHASLQPSAAAWFHARGRDVWVVDLRTSTGLPTATRPWTMEQVAWIDIPAALLHVRQATGGPVDVLAHCIGCVMLSMALLARPEELDQRAEDFERAPPLNDTQRARLAAFHGAGRSASPQAPSAGGAAEAHATVRRIVLSQKGPVLRYTDANVLRGWLMQFLRRWLLPAGLQFRPSAQPGAAEQLLDRLLASLPYPDADWAVENPWQPWRRTEWTATRHRMDLLYGRDFEAANLSQATLNAIDDLFGPMNLDTLAQTLHFTRMDMATDSVGQGLVTGALLRERWAGIPTLALHGAANGLVDAWTQRLLAAWLVPAGVPLSCRTYDGIGHQDLLIGRDAARVFGDIEDFLAGPPPDTPPHAAVDAPSRQAMGTPVAFTAPWLGPRIDIERSRAVRVAAMPGPQAGPGRLVLLPVRTGADGKLTLDLDAPLHVADGRTTAPRHWQFAHPSPGARCGSGADASADASDYAVADSMADSSAGSGATSVADPVPDAAADADLVPGWVVAFAHHPAQVGPSGRALDFPWPGLNGSPPPHPALDTLPPGHDAPQPPRRLRDAPAWAATAQAWLDAMRETAGRPEGGQASAAACGDDSAHTGPSGPVDPGRPIGAAGVSGPSDLTRQATYIPAHALSLVASRLAPRAATTLRIAVASCQYPHGPLDLQPAQASLQTMATRASRGDIDLVLFLGDQIYADATAGLVDPTTRDERYVQPYERAFSAPGMRRVLARVPALMVPDDHELVDNWEPRPAHGGSDAALWALREASARDGRWAYWRHARLRPKLRHPLKPLAGQPVSPPNPGVGLDNRTAGMTLTDGATLHHPTPPPRTADKAFRFGGVPCFVLDTRLGRSERGGAADGGPPPRMMSPCTWMRLQDWLLRHRDAVKLVAGPSLLLPRRREAVDEPANAARCDSWDGYPADRERLLDFLARHRIGRTVFVSGDEHHRLACEITLQARGNGASVKALSVHSSALYAPFPFANGHPHDLSDKEFHTAAGTQVTMRTTWAPAGDGFAVLQLPASASLGAADEGRDGQDDQVVVRWVQPEAPDREDRFRFSARSSSP